MKSRWHKYQHTIRLARRLALKGNESAYKRYLRLVDHDPYPTNHAPLVRQLSRVRGYLIMREMGWTTAR